MIYLYTPWENRWKKSTLEAFQKKGFDAVWSIQETELKANDTFVSMWADPVAAQVSSYTNVRFFTYIRSYEIVSYPLSEMIHWDNTKAIFYCCPFVKQYSNYKYPEIKQNNIPQHTILNWLDTSEWPYQKRTHGKKIAMICSIHYKKNIPLAFYLLDKLPRDYSLHLIGSLQDPMTMLYLDNLAKILKFDGRFVYRGNCPMDKVKDFLKDKDYILSTSLKEGCPMNVLEAMAMGIKPIIHNWPGADLIFPKKWVFNTIDEAIPMFDGEYDSEEYRNFVIQNHNPRNAEKLVEVVTGD